LNQARFLAICESHESRQKTTERDTERQPVLVVVLAEFGVFERPAFAGLSLKIAQA